MINKIELKEQLSFSNNKLKDLSIKAGILSAKVMFVALTVIGTAVTTYMLGRLGTSFLSRNTLRTRWLVTYSRNAFFAAPLIIGSVLTGYFVLQTIAKAFKGDMFRLTDHNWKDITQFSKDIFTSYVKGATYGAAFGTIVSICCGFRIS